MSMLRLHVIKIRYKIALGFTFHSLGSFTIANAGVELVDHIKLKDDSSLFGYAQKHLKFVNLSR